MGLAEALTLAGIVAVVGVGISLSLYRREPLDVGIAAILVVVGVILLVDVAAYATDFRDADGAIDCWSNCDVLQTLVRWTVPLGAVLLPVLVVIAAVRAALGRARRST